MRKFFSAILLITSFWASAQIDPIQSGESGASVRSKLNQLIALANAGLQYPLLAPNGTAGAPSYSFESSINSGFYSQTLNVIDVSLLGVNEYRFTSAAFEPRTNGQNNLGTGALQWGSLFVNNVENNSSNLQLFGNSSVIVENIAINGNQISNNIGSDVAFGDNIIPNVSGSFQVGTADNRFGLFTGNRYNVGGNADNRITVAGGTLLIGSSSGINFENQYTFPLLDGTANQVLTTNGLGQLSFQDASGGITFPLTAPNGLNTQPSYSFDSDNTSGMYLSSIANLSFAVGGAIRFNIGGTGILSYTNILPTNNNLFTLGSLTNSWNNVFSSEFTAGSTQIRTNQVQTNGNTTYEVNGIDSDLLLYAGGNLNFFADLDDGSGTNDTGGFTFNVAALPRLQLQEGQLNSDNVLTTYGTGNNILSNYVFDGDQTVGVGQDNYVLKYDHSVGNISLEPESGGGGGGIGGSISDNQIAVGSTTADEIEGSSSLIFDGTNVVGSVNGGSRLILEDAGEAVDEKGMFISVTAGNMLIGSSNDNRSAFSTIMQLNRSTQDVIFLGDILGSTNSQVGSDAIGIDRYYADQNATPQTVPYTFEGDNDTGMGRPAANQIHFATSGRAALLINTASLNAPVLEINPETANIVSIETEADDNSLRIAGGSTANLSQGAFITLGGASNSFDADYAARTAHDFRVGSSGTGLSQMEITDSEIDVKLNDINSIATVNFTSVTRTISGGSFAAASTNCIVVTEGGAGTDDLDTIAAGSSGDIIILRAPNDIQTVVVKNGTGNIVLSGSDFSLDNSLDTIILMYNGTNWLEISRSDNGS